MIRKSKRKVLLMIYLLEDDAGIRSFVLYALNNCGFVAEGFETPSEFYSAFEKKKPELLLLDIMLPEEDGISILKKIRSSSETRRLPVILISAKGTEFDKVTGLDSGADDYIAKPFGTMELISRIKALLRRTAPDDDGIYLTAGKIRINTDMRDVFVEDRKVVLTLKEYELLAALIKNRGKVLSRDILLSKVWGFDFSGESRTVDVHIRSLRAKLGESGEIIETIRGVGYRIGETDA